MLTIRLPDGKLKHFDHKVSVCTVLDSLDQGISENAIAAKINDELVDLSYLIDIDCTIDAIITAQHELGLNIIRHSAAHLLAQAVKRLYPQTQVTIGPVIENGFYYDFAFERPFTPDDLQKIETMMRTIVHEDLPIVRRELSHTEARNYFLEINEGYKVKIIDSIPISETLSLYKQGEFEDLCRGPHVPSTKYLKAFKLTKVAGAYWRGDAKNEMLQRIYGTAWADDSALATYLHRLEEAEKRDHRHLGKILDLFHFNELAPGMVFWHPKGFIIYQIIQQYMRE